MPLRPDAFFQIGDELLCFFFGQVHLELAAAGMGKIQRVKINSRSALLCFFPYGKLFLDGLYYE